VNDLDAIRNRRTQRLFILIEDSLKGRYRVINPGGELVSLPVELFEEEPITVTPDEFAEAFTPEQLTASAQYQAQIEAENRQAEASILARAKAPPPPPPRKTSGSRRSAAPTSTRTGLGAQWKSHRLTFYRHEIERLGLKQSFRVLVEGSGSYEMTRADFQNYFNDVIVSAKYISEGIFSYPQVPDKAKKFLKAL